MTEHEFKSLKKGDKVRIVSKWPSNGSAYQNAAGEMDCWLGKIMTIAYIPIGTGYFASCVEDKGEWCWNRFAFDSKVTVSSIGIEEMI